jgi:hypothetical protein
MVPGFFFGRLAQVVGRKQVGFHIGAASQRQRSDVAQLFMGSLPFRFVGRVR